MTLIFESLPIPSPYRNINYSFPIYINLICLVYRLFDYWFLDLSRTRMTKKKYAELFIYLNSIGLIVHLFLGIGGKNSKGILPSLLSLDHRYIWFPILTYVIFFLVATLTILISKNIEKKKRMKNKGKSQYSYGIFVLKNAVLNHCGIKTKRVCILGEVGRAVNTASMREKYLRKVVEEVNKL